MTPEVNSSEYVQWLRGRVGGLDPSLDIFFAVLWDIPYLWTVADDANRAKDGLTLRRYFLSETAQDLYLFDRMECTVLEFLVALAGRLNDLTYDWESPNEVPRWFETLIDHLELESYDNECLKVLGTGEIEAKIQRMMRREYAPDGTEGGLFPLTGVTDVTFYQHELSVWLQMQRYLMEQI